VAITQLSETPGDGGTQAQVVPTQVSPLTQDGAQGPDTHLAFKQTWPAGQELLVHLQVRLAGSQSGVEPAQGGMQPGDVQMPALQIWPGTQQTPPHTVVEQPPG
jgi:hypothetical protein